MSIHWQKICKGVWRLDNVWQVVEETKDAWRVYQGDRAKLESGTLDWAMKEAERMRKEAT